MCNNDAHCSRECTRERAIEGQFCQASTWQGGHTWQSQPSMATSLASEVGRSQETRGR
jgi:hypothetical protein